MNFGIRLPYTHKVSIRYLGELRRVELVESKHQKPTVAHALRLAGCEITDKHIIDDSFAVGTLDKIGKNNLHEVDYINVTEGRLPSAKEKATLQEKINALSSSISKLNCQKYKLEEFLKVIPTGEKI